MADKIRLSCLIGVLLVSTVDLRWMSHGHPVPPRKDFASFPFQLAEWSGTDLVLSPGTVRVLAADNYLLRSYRNRVSGAEVELFVVYYSAQRSGDALHSPRNCLPGAGWEPVSSGFLEISNPTPAGSFFPANHYVIEKDGVRQDVLYWYQAHGREFASEYLGKIYLAWDGITRGRTDGALVRITAVHAPGNTGTLPVMVSFAQDLSSVLPQFLPN
ncbi:MAG TPA: EpsI family protein [Candidatus Binatus sp.]|jgi:EpsI family protein|nr:EpsI family protein [Candidatus Binatus sp.]